MLSIAVVPLHNGARCVSTGIQSYWHFNVALDIHRQEMAGHTFFPIVAARRASKFHPPCCSIGVSRWCHGTSTPRCD